MKIVELDQPGQLLESVYEEVLTPSFPPAELCDLDSIAEGVTPGTTTVTAVINESGRPIAAAVGDWSRRSRVQLLSYLAVLPEHRSRGIGGRLLTYVLDGWRVDRRPCAILAEIEHPAAHEPSDAYGDPAARARFYARYGAVALDLPYFQPALRSTSSRYYGMILISMHVDPELAGTLPGSVAGPAVREFMAEYLELTEGGVADDPATDTLFAAIDRPEGIPTLPLDDLGRLPVSTG